MMDQSVKKRTCILLNKKFNNISFNNISFYDTDLQPFSVMLLIKIILTTLYICQLDQGHLI